MVVDDRIRLRIHSKLEALIGTEEADALVTHALPAPGQEVATKDDLRVLSAELRGEIEKLRGEMHGEIGSVRGDVRAELQSVLASQTRWMIGFMMTWSAVVLAAARLLF